jgi:hypothetical protein
MASCGCLGLRHENFLQTPFQPCTQEQPNGQVRGRQHGDHPEKRALGRCGSVQVFKAAEHVEASEAEEGSGDGEGHQRSAIGNNLLRKTRLVIRHRFAFPQLSHNPEVPRSGVSGHAGAVQTTG